MNTVKPPCEAYHLVAAWLGPEWFKTPPVNTGVLAVIGGSDGSTSRWHLDKTTANALRIYAWHHPHLVPKAFTTFSRTSEAFTGL